MAHRHNVHVRKSAIRLGAPVEPVAQAHDLADDQDRRRAELSRAMRSGSSASVPVTTRCRRHVPHSITAAGVSGATPVAIS